MKILKPIEKGYNKVVKVLTKQFGFEGDIYFPLAVNNLKHGFRDNDIEYNNEEPDISQKLLIPSLLRAKENSPLIVIDENDGTFLWVQNTLVLPELSKIILRNKTGVIQNFQILKRHTAKDDERIIYGKYELVPLTKIDVEINREELEDNLDLSEDEAEDYKILQDDLSMPEEQVEEESTPSYTDDKTYSPIGG